VGGIRAKLDAFQKIRLTVFGKGLAMNNNTHTHTHIYIRDKGCEQVIPISCTISRRASILPTCKYISVWGLNKNNGKYLGITERLNEIMVS